MMTLVDVAKAFGISIKGQNVLHRVRKLEEATGRKILIERGTGHGRRYMIHPDAFASALHGVPAPEPIADATDLGDLASRIADTVQAMDNRHTGMSLELADLRRQHAATCNVVWALNLKLREAREALRLRRDTMTEELAVLRDRVLALESWAGRGVGPVVRQRCITDLGILRRKDREAWKAKVAAAIGKSKTLGDAADVLGVSRSRLGGWVREIRAEEKQAA